MVEAAGVPEPHVQALKRRVNEQLPGLHFLRQSSPRKHIQTIREGKQGTVLSREAYRDIVAFIFQ